MNKTAIERYSRPKIDSEKIWLITAIFLYSPSKLPINTIVIKGLVNWYIIYLKKKATLKKIKFFLNIIVSNTKIPYKAKLNPTAKILFD